MDRRDYLTIAQLARLTQIGERTLHRYFKETPYLKRWGRLIGKRKLWHRNVIPRLRQMHESGLARRGRGYVDGL